MKNNQRLELLAPVGHFEGMRAAVAQGADAVYVGGPSFGARKEASFTHEDLITVIKFCHLYNVRVYVTINTTVFDDELEEITEYIHFLYMNQVDAVIVQDLGVASLVKTLYPDFEMHMSTQMHLHNASGVAFAKSVGAERIVAARENSLDEIKQMCTVGLDVEVFVHGALCVCYSGQCLLSSMNGDRSGNRGACAQPCRLPYELVDVATGAVLESAVGDYLLSPKDLKTIDDIGALIDAGVTSFKIEGRLKKPEYVASAVRAYRVAIDQYVQKGVVAVDDVLHEQMAQIFSRTFTTGHLHGQGHLDWIAPARPGHRGILIGKVTHVKGNRATVKLTSDLHLHDGVRFVGNHETGMEVQKMFVDGADVKVAFVGSVDLMCNFEPHVGMLVYKTASITLTKALTVVQMPKISINGEVVVAVGAPVSLTLWDDLGHVVTVVSKENVLQAAHAGITEARLKQQLAKTGQSPFELVHLALNVGDACQIPISAINGLRREGLDALEAERKNWHPDRQPSRTILPPTTVATTADKPMLTVSVTTFAQLESVCQSPHVDVIYYQHLPTLKAATELAKAHQKTLIPQLSRVVTDKQIMQVKKRLQELNLSAVMVGEYGALDAFLPDFDVSCDHGFGVNNAIHLAKFKDLGVSHATTGHEITAIQIQELVKKGSMPVETIVYGRVPVMVMKHCPLLIHYQPEGGACKGKYCQVLHGLKNRFDRIMPLVETSHCRLEMLNHEPLNWLKQMKQLKKMGIQRFRLAFTTETHDDILTVLEKFNLALGHEEIDHEWLKEQTFTLGHYHKGIK